MAAYCYKVHDSKGRIFKSTCQAESEAAKRRKHLTRDGELSARCLCLVEAADM